MILKDVHSPDDIKRLNYSDLYDLSSQIRNKIINTVEENGGHLSSNLGVVELTIALHRVFNGPDDKIIFDVGHQTYTHKLLTGRYDKFNTLRQHNGISGFPRYNESKYDAFEVGHASTSISAALGMARARDLSKGKYNIVAVIGDGSLTGGMAYEALNDVINSKTKLIVVLNDNEMSISRNVGAISKHLSELRISKSYINVRERIKKRTIAIPIIGKYLYYAIHYFKKFIKRIFIGENFFTSLGFHYIGPIDGHNIKQIEEQLNIAKEYDGPVIVHCVTKKGYGLPKAESKPDIMHGISPKSKHSLSNYELNAGSVACQKLLSLMENDDKIVVITAAMAFGTGTEIIKEKYPDRFFDVGITEEHAVTMCAGLAKSGYKPYFFVYSTFAQRSFDQIINDVYLQNLPVVFCIDRCNLSGADGVTHHGIYDLGIFNTLPGFSVYTAYSKFELENFIDSSTKTTAPLAIRYGKDVIDLDSNQKLIEGKWNKIIDGSDFVIISYGYILSSVIDACNLLKCNDYLPCLYNAYTLEPIDYQLLETLSKLKKTVIVIEEHIVNNGLGSKIALLKALNNYSFKLSIIGIQSRNIQHGDRKELLKDAGLDPESLYNSIINIVGKKDGQKKN